MTSHSIPITKIIKKKTSALIKFQFQTILLMILMMILCVIFYKLCHELI